ncbi:MAG: hypothetical protein Q7V20_14925 [Aquabacterium sp.]|nr:hypothetical protein [Aquabacterium sp.]MDO9004738.1 hypothetical protein [Aquabacterium sp.]
MLVDVILMRHKGSKIGRELLATIARLVEMANKVQETRDRMTLLRVVNG